MRGAVLLAVAGCSFSPRPANIDPTGDGGVDAIDARVVDAIDARLIDAGANCVGADPYLICLQAIPMMARTFGAQTLSTDACTDGEVHTHGAQQLCVLAFTGVTITGNKVRAEGSRPLVIVATGNLTVAAGAYVDVSSFVGSQPGAGANFAGCVAGAAGGDDNNGGGGGAGGSFGTAGAAGGTGAGGAGGMPATAVPPSSLRGGCAGARGGNGQGAGGGGGSSGGALYLVAGVTLTIAGTIDASAAGGLGGPSGKNAGGGGGSGGLIALYAGGDITMVVGAQVFANGAGGGAGGDSNTAGGNGQQSATFDDIPAGGTNGSANGGDGAAQAQPSKPGSNSSKGAGGGGGGLGAIENVSGQSLTGSFSPSPS